MVWPFWLVLLLRLAYASALPHHYKDEKTETSEPRLFSHDLHSLQHGINQTLRKSESILHNLHDKLHSLHDHLINIKQHHQDAIIHHGNKFKDWIKNPTSLIKRPSVEETPLNVSDFLTTTELAESPENSHPRRTNSNLNPGINSTYLTELADNSSKATKGDDGNKPNANHQSVNPKVINLINSSVVFNTIIEKQNSNEKHPISVAESSNSSVDLQRHNNSSVKTSQQNNFDLHLPDTTVSTFLSTNFDFEDVSEIPTESAINPLVTADQDKSSVINASSETPLTIQEDSKPSGGISEALPSASGPKTIDSILNKSEQNLTFQEPAETYPETTALSNNNGKDFNNFTFTTTDRPIKFPDEWDAAFIGRATAETNSSLSSQRTEVSTKSSLTFEESEDTIDVRFGGLDAIQNRNGKQKALVHNIGDTKSGDKGIRLGNLTKLLSNRDFKDTILKYYNKNNNTSKQAVGNITSPQTDLRVNRSDFYNHKGHHRSKRFADDSRLDDDVLENESMVQKRNDSDGVSSSVSNNHSTASNILPAMKDSVNDDYHLKTIINFFPVISMYQVPLSSFFGYGENPSEENRKYFVNINDEYRDSSENANNRSHIKENNGTVNGERNSDLKSVVRELTLNDTASSLLTRLLYEETADDPRMKKSIEAGVDPILSQNRSFVVNATGDGVGTVKGNGHLSRISTLYPEGIVSSELLKNIQEAYSSKKFTEEDLETVNQLLADMLILFRERSIGSEALDKSKRGAVSKGRRSRDVKDAATTERLGGDHGKTQKATEAEDILALLSESHHRYQQDEPYTSEEELYSYEEDEEYYYDNDENISDAPRDAEYSDEASFGDLISLALKHRSRKEEPKQSDGLDETDS